MIQVYIKSNILPPYPRQSPTGLASTINISKSYVWEKYASSSLGKRQEH